MKHWKIGEINKGYWHEVGMMLCDEEGVGVFSIYKTPEGSIRIMEECDGYYSLELSQKDAIEALEEAIEYIRSDR